MFGGVTEHVEDVSDPAYRAALTSYHLHMAHAEFDILARALTLVEPEDWQSDPRTAELCSLGIHIPILTEYLRYVALTEADDLLAVMEEVLYLSTVTRRGIEEAERAFDVHYKGAALHKHPSPGGDLRISALFQARLASTEHGYLWPEFCTLTGPEQSAVVAQYQVTRKIQWLADRDRNHQFKAGR